MGAKRFEIVEHTADKGIRAYGRSLLEVFENAAYGMFSLVIDASRADTAGRRDVGVTGFDKEELLVRWLGELLFLYETEGAAFCGFHIRELDQVEEGGPWRLRATCDYAAAADKIERKASPVKAVTYHGLKIEESQGIWAASVIFDV